MRAQDLMTANPACVTPDDKAQHVAQLMEEHDCGCIPVVESRESSRVIGVVTDRDLALRGTARGKGPETAVRDLMTPDPHCCPVDADVDDVQRVMSDRQVRRVVVVDADGGCVGMIAQADLALAAEGNRGVTDRDVANLVERISEPERSVP